jgi:hypothetical protein
MSLTIFSQKEILMKLNKSITDRLKNLTDDELWAEIRKMAAGYGLSLPDRTPSAGDLAKVRDALNIGEVNMTDAMRIVNEYKRGKR